MFSDKVLRNSVQVPSTDDLKVGECSDQVYFQYLFECNQVYEEKVRNTIQI